MSSLDEFEKRFRMGLNRSTDTITDEMTYFWRRLFGMALFRYEYEVMQTHPGIAQPGNVAELPKPSPKK